MGDAREDNYIDTSKLQIGMTVKNYKELCILLGQEIKFGNSKKAQLENWKRYFSFHKPENKKFYYIIDIYDKPKEKTENRGRSSVYLRYVEIILLNYLSNKEGNTESLIKKQWWNVLGFKDNDWNIEESIKHMEECDISIKQRTITNFCERCNRKMDSILMSALRSLKNRKLINYKTEIVLVKNKTQVIANDDDEEDILKAERRILVDEMKMDSIVQVFLRNEQEQYFSLVNKYVYKHYGYNWYYRRIKIIYNKENVKEVLGIDDEELSNLDKKEIMRNKTELNGKIVDFMKAQAKKFCEKNIVNETDIDSPAYEDDEKIINEIRANYLANQNILIDELLKYKSYEEESEEYKQNLEEAKERIIQEREAKKNNSMKIYDMSDSFAPLESLDEIYNSIDKEEMLDCFTEDDLPEDLPFDTGNSSRIDTILAHMNIDEEFVRSCSEDDYSQSYIRNSLNINNNTSIKWDDDLDEMMA